MLVLRLRDICTIHDFIVVESCVWKDAYGWVHPVLDIQKVLLVSQ